MSFIDHFSNIDDPRKSINLKYDFLDMLFLTIAIRVSEVEGGATLSQSYNCAYLLPKIDFIFTFGGVFYRNR